MMSHVTLFVHVMTSGCRWEAGHNLIMLLSSDVEGLLDLPSDVNVLLVSNLDSYLASLGLVLFDCRCCLFVVFPLSLP